jgi:hypothetical protein
MSRLGLALVLGGVGALDAVADVLVQVLRVMVELLVRLIKDTGAGVRR